MNTLPQHVLSAITYSDYDVPLDEKVISVSSLIDAPHYRKLALQHKEVQADPEDLIVTMFGSIGHSIVERSDHRTIRELRIDHKIRDFVLTGKFDNYDPRTKILYDNKFVHHKSLDYPSTKLKWEQQMNTYAFLMETEFDWEVKKLVIIVWIRDMTKMDAVKPDYPDQMVFQVELPLWSYEQQYKYVHERILYHERYNGLGCTPYERWATDKAWAVTKKKAFRAYRLFSDKRAAAELLMSLRRKGKKDYRIEYRAPEDRRCKSCKFKKVCEYALHKELNKYREMLNVK